MAAAKDHLYDQVARIGKALASPKRLELIDLLCQGEKSVEFAPGRSSPTPICRMRSRELARK